MAGEDNRQAEDKATFGKRKPMQIDLGTTATMRQIEDLRMALLAAVESGEDIAVDADAIEEAALSLVQLLEAARGHLANLAGGADDAGSQALRLERPANPVLLALLERGGFLTAPDPAARRFWLHEEPAR